MGRADRRVLEHLSASNGVITRREALALGMPPSTLHEWVRTGHLIRMGRGLYVQPAVLSTERSVLAAATAALDAVVSHESAGRIHGLPGLDLRRVTVTVPVRRSNRYPGVIVRQSTDLRSEDCVEVDGLPVTNINRTLLDLAAVQKVGTLAICTDDAVRRRLTTYEGVAEYLHTMARKGKPGVTKLRSVLRPRLGGTYVTDSVLETRLYAVLIEGGLPGPSTQYRPSWLRKINGRVDLSYVEEQVIVEGDSMRFHGTPEQFQLDRIRDNLAQAAGWIVLRFTWDDIVNRPQYIVNLVEQVLSMRSRSGIPDVVH